MKQLMILIILAVGITLVSNSEEYVEIPVSSIRMRVIAASDSEEDQAEKLVVKSIVEESLYDLINGVKSEDEVDELIRIHAEEIDEYIGQKIKKYGLDIPFESNFGYNYFPEKTFKGLTYKAGNYKSFVVTLGEGKGENWWCVLYPPLCLIDESADNYEYHSLIKDTILKYN